MDILILGGDGFIGWPLALHLSNVGHKIHIVDNFSRRKIDDELGVQSVTPIHSLPNRLRKWKEHTGHDIEYTTLDVSGDYSDLLDLLGDLKPDAVVHLAEQKSAPYSMKSSKHRRYTVNTNVSATHNLLSAIVECGINPHVVHIGTMGVYGYSSIGAKIPEGYLDVRVQNLSGEWIDQQILYPTKPGSIYHMTKSLDQIIFQFYAQNFSLKITDLHQGIVWGSKTPETSLDPTLINRFDYDGDWGTVLNRFLIQAALKYPLTVHGSGGQTRAFININDSMQCISLALMAPPSEGNVAIFNQMTETHRVRDLASLISKMSNIDFHLQENPRLEAEANDLVVENDKFIKLGLQPTYIKDQLLEELLDIAKNYTDRIDVQKIKASTSWVSK